MLAAHLRKPAASSIQKLICAPKHLVWWSHENLYYKIDLENVLQV